MAPLKRAAELRSAHHDSGHWLRRDGWVRHGPPGAPLAISGIFAAKDDNLGNSCTFRNGLGDRTIPLYAALPDLHVA